MLCSNLTQILLFLPRQAHLINLIVNVSKKLIKTKPGQRNMYYQDMLYRNFESIEKCFDFYVLSCI